MSLVYKDRVRQDCTAPATSSPFDFDVGGSTPTGYQAWDAALADAETAIYSASDTSGNWEVGVGTWNEAGNYLTRTTILSSSNAGSSETFSGAVTVDLSNDASQMDVLEMVRLSGFSAHGDGSTQTNCGTATGTTYITSGFTEAFNPDGDFASGVYQPTKAGLYIIGGTLVGGNHDDAKYCAIYLFHSTDGSSWSASDTKAGLLWRGAASASQQIGGSGAVVVEANGTTDRWKLGYFHSGNSVAINVPSSAANKPWQRFWARYIGEAS